MPRCFWMLTIPLLLALPGCAHSGAPADAGPQAATEIQATVVYVDLEGGFFGLVDRDGHRYDPGRLPAEFRVDGLAVRARVSPLPPRVSVRMWGQQVELLAIERR